MSRIQTGLFHRFLVHLPERVPLEKWLGYHSQRPMRLTKSLFYNI
jgi:hypothetical protein